MKCPLTIEEIRTALSADRNVPCDVYGKQYSLLLQKEPLQKRPSRAIFLHKFNRIIHFDLKRQTIRVQAGCTLNQINDFLAERGFSLASYPEFFDITAGACVATPVHGYSTRHQCLASLVTEVKYLQRDTGECVDICQDDSDWSAIFFGRTPNVVILEITFSCVPRSRQFMSLSVLSDSQLEPTLLANTSPQQIITWYPGAGKISEIQINDKAMPGVHYRHLKRPITLYRYMGYAIFVLQMYLKRASHVCGDSNQLAPGFRHLSPIERLFIAKGAAVDVEISLPLTDLRCYIDAVCQRPHPERQLFVGFRWGGLKGPAREKLWRQDADLWVEMVGDESVIRHVIGQLDRRRIAFHPGKYLIDRERA